MSYQLVTPASVLPVSVDQVKAQLRVTSDDEDVRFRELIWRAARHVEKQTGFGLTAATWKLYLDRFPTGAGEIQIRRLPVSSITAVRHYDAANDQQTLATSAYDSDLISKPARIKPVDGTTWPTTYRRLNCVEVEFVVGVATAALVPDPAVQLILLLIEQWYEPAADMKTAGAAAATIEALMNDLRWASHA